MPTPPKPDGRPVKLTPEKRTRLAELMARDCMTQRELANAVEISIRQVQRVKKEPAFQRLVELETKLLYDPSPRDTVDEIRRKTKDDRLRLRAAAIQLQYETEVEREQDAPVRLPDGAILVYPDAQLPAVDDD